MRLLAGGVAALLSLTHTVAAATLPVIVKVPSIQAIAGGYTGFDLDGDGVREINSLSLMSFEPVTPGAGAKGIAIVLVEPRLLASPSAAYNSAVLAKLQAYRDDLANDGYATRFLLADVYHGTDNQDGRTLLAIRRFLQSVRSSYPNLAGVTLVGSFPEATIFRRTLVEEVLPDQRRLLVHPERINPRADIVLGDLDGNWESLYERVADHRHLRATIPAGVSLQSPPPYFTGTVVESSTVHWEDIFYIEDDSVGWLTAGNVGDPVLVHVAATTQRNPETTAADRAQPNPVARPEILVSRIDARGIAVNPVADSPDTDGKQLLDAQGRPQTVHYAGFLPLVGMQHDAILEQRILIDYFDRNHAHRLGIEPAGYYRTATITQMDSGLHAPSVTTSYLRAADPTLLGAAKEFPQATLTDYVSFLRTPAVLREVEAHSNALVSDFFDNDALVGPPHTYDPLLVQAQIGDRVWAWQNSAAPTPTGTLYTSTPSAAPLYDIADWRLGRTLWESRVLLYAGQSFFVHGGCSINVPDGNTPNLAYTDARYGLMNNADSILFFENGLAILARGKVYNDLPAGFGASLRNSAQRFGSAWTGMFATDAANAALAPGNSVDYDRVPASKRSYFWSLRGDWSLRLR